MADSGTPATHAARFIAATTCGHHRYETNSPVSICWCRTCRTWVPLIVRRLPTVTR